MESKGRTMVEREEKRAARRASKTTSIVAARKADELLDAEGVDVLAHDERNANDIDYKASNTSKKHKTGSHSKRNTRKSSSSSRQVEKASENEVCFSKLPTSALIRYASVYSVVQQPSLYGRADLVHLCSEHFRYELEVDEVADECDTMLTFAANLLNQRAISLEHRDDPTFFLQQQQQQEEADTTHTASQNAQKTNEHSQTRSSDDPAHVRHFSFDRGGQHATKNETASTNATGPSNCDRTAPETQQKRNRMLNGVSPSATHGSQMEYTVAKQEAENHGPAEHCCSE